MKGLLNRIAIVPLLLGIAACDEHEGGRHGRGYRDYDDSVTTYTPSPSDTATSDGQADHARTAAAPQVGTADAGVDPDASDSSDASVPEEPAEAGAE